MAETLRPDQIEDLAFLIANKRCGVLNDPGTGKTPTVDMFCEYLWQYEQKKVLFPQPKSLLKKNKRELLRFTNFEEDEIIIVDGTPKQRAALIASPRGKVFLMGFKRFADDWRLIKEHHPEIDAVIVDEIHMGFKSHDSQRTKQLFMAMREIERFVAMSGTLIDGRLDSCYPTIKIIEPRYYTNHRSFLAQHALTDEFGRVIEWINHAKLGRIFQRHCIRRTFESIFGKVDKVIQTELCEMHPKQREKYDEFESTAVLELEDKFLDGTNPAVAAIRCRQIMAHPHTMGLLEPDEQTGKDARLEVHLEDHLNKGTPVLIYATLVPEQERIALMCAKMGFNVGLMNGNVSSKERGQVDEDFQSGKLNCVVGSPPTAAVGYNWQHVDHVIFASLDYQNSNFDQAYKRCVRGKRDKPLWITVLEYEDSIDQRIFEIVNKKSQDAAKVDSTYETLDLGVKDIEDESDDSQEDGADGN